MISDSVVLEPKRHATNNDEMDKDRNTGPRHAVRQISEKKSRAYAKKMSITVSDVPLANQVFQLPGLSHFQKAINLDDLLLAMPENERPSRSYHKPKILQKLNILRFYVSLDSNINETLPLSSLKRNKVVWVPMREARRVLKDQADVLLPITEDNADDVDGIQFPTQARAGGTTLRTSAATADALPTLQSISIPEAEQFVDSDGKSVHISVCGDRTYEGMHFFVSHIYIACEHDTVNMSDLSGITIQDVKVDGHIVSVVDFRNAMRLFAHFDRNGSSFAMLAMEWCSKVMHAVQYGDAHAPRPERMAAHMRTVAGRNCANPMAECTSKMIYIESMGDVATLGEAWPELEAFVPSGGDAAEYDVIKVGEGSGHQVGDNARAIRVVHPLAEPECYDFRPTMLDKKQRMSVEKAFADVFGEYMLAPNLAQRFAGDTELFVLHKSKLARAWKFIQCEVTGLEDDLTKTIGDTQVSDLKHQLEIAALQAKISQMQLAAHTLPPAAQERFHAVLRSCNAGA